MLKKRWFRVAATARRHRRSPAAYLVSKIDLGKTATRSRAPASGWLALSALLTVVTVPPQACRWQLLLRARGVEESIAWLTRAYFVSYAVGQVLPTGVGGDASRIYETTRRHPGAGLADRGLGRARAGDRRSGDARPRRARASCSRSATTRSGRTSGSRRSSSSGRSSPGVVVFSARLRRHLRRAVPLLRAAARRADRAGRSTRASTATATTLRRCSSSPAITARGAGLAHRRDLGGRPRRRGRARAPAVRRARAAALPRDARARSRSTGSAFARRSSSAS